MSCENPVPLDELVAFYDSLDIEERLELLEAMLAAASVGTDELRMILEQRLLSFSVGRDIARLPDAGP